MDLCIIHWSTSRHRTQLRWFVRFRLAKISVWVWVLLRLLRFLRTRLFWSVRLTNTMSYSMARRLSQVSFFSPFLRKSVFWTSVKLKFPIKLYRFTCGIILLRICLAHLPSIADSLVFSASACYKVSCILYSVINQSINQSINESMNQSMNQSINPSIHPSIHQSISQSMADACGIWRFSLRQNRNITSPLNGLFSQTSLTRNTGNLEWRKVPKSWTQRWTYPLVRRKIRHSRSGQNLKNGSPSTSEGSFSKPHFSRSQLRSRNRSWLKCSHTRPRDRPLGARKRTHLDPCSLTDPGILFEALLNYLRTGKLILSQTTPLESIFVEAEFFNFEKLLEELKPCAKRLRSPGGISNVTNWLIAWLMAEFTDGWMVNRSIDWLIDWSIDRLNNWLIDWLIDWSVDLGFVEWFHPLYRFIFPQISCLDAPLQEGFWISQAWQSQWHCHGRMWFGHWWWRRPHKSCAFRELTLKGVIYRSWTCGASIWNSRTSGAQTSPTAISRTPTWIGPIWPGLCWTTPSCSAWKCPVPLWKDVRCSAWIWMIQVFSSDFHF